jgi:hypothetical protein
VSLLFEVHLCRHMLSIQVFLEKNFLSTVWLQRNRLPSARSSTASEAPKTWLASDGFCLKTASQTPLKISKDI